MLKYAIEYCNGQCRIATKQSLKEELFANNTYIRAIYKIDKNVAPAVVSSVVGL